MENKSDYNEEQVKIASNTECYSWSEKLNASILQIVKQLQDNVKNIYIKVWHDVSVIPNQEGITANDLYLIRRRRIFFLAVHLMALLGFYYSLTGKVKSYTILFAICLGIFSSIGATAGAHRLWSHRSYKATWQLRLILIVFQTLSVQYSALNWAKDHRLHHKHTDTDADPHNSERGFYFCHIGWAVNLPHPLVEEKLKTIDVSDVEQDKIAMFQYNYYVPLVMIISYILPTFIPMYFWNESIYMSHLVCVQLRHAITLHGTFLINSAAHMWGTRPYDKNINPTENLIVSAATFGDGWHNYHHVFPWDYKNAEFSYYLLNIATAFIDLFALIGWAYDRKTVPEKLIAKRAHRTGDGSHHSLHSSNSWGWGDKDMPDEEKKAAIVN